MRALRITMRVAKPVVLPLAYNELVQGLLYSCWRDSFPELHDEGFGTGRNMRLFVFGPLQGKCSISRAKKTIRFEGTVSFEVRSLLEELIDELARQLSARDLVRLGAHEMELVNLQACDRLLFPQRAILRMASPVAVYDTSLDGHTRFYSPDEARWIDLVGSNARRKAELLMPDVEPSMVVIPRSETLSKHVTRFKGTYVTGWTGEFIAACDPRLLSLLYYTGLGAKNSQGFGIFNISDERP